jgi:MoxR-like ATPase
VEDVTDPAAKVREIRLKARRFASRLDDISEEFVDRDEIVRVLGLAVLCREHVLLIGPPGVAKSSLVDRFSQILDVRQFTYLLSRFTEPAELFGPLDVPLFQRDGIFRVNTVGMLPEAELVLLDEVFQGSSAILNSLLTLINERTFFNGGAKQPAPILSVLGATNELPQDPALAAFSDRFLLRVTVNYVPKDLVEDVLVAGWRHERRLAADALDEEAHSAARFSLADLRQLQDEVTRVDVSGVRSLLAQVVGNLRSEGVTFSDRRAVKAQKLIAANALLGARQQAEPADLAVLTSMWTNQEDEATIRRVLDQADVPAPERVRKVRDSSAIVLELRSLGAPNGYAETREELRERARRLHNLAREARSDHPGDQELAGAIHAEYEACLAALKSLIDSGVREAQSV